ncbi:hypothetical protein ACU8KH_01635 [Lachancea thermotolerans]
MGPAGSFDYLVGFSAAQKAAQEIVEFAQLILHCTATTNCYKWRIVYSSKNTTLLVSEYCLLFLRLFFQEHVLGNLVLEGPSKDCSMPFIQVNNVK